MTEIAGALLSMRRWLSSRLTAKLIHLSPLSTHSPNDPPPNYDLPPINGEDVEPSAPPAADEGSSLLQVSAVCEIIRWCTDVPVRVNMHDLCMRMCI